MFKYKKVSDESFGDKLAKLSFHTIKKKGSRFKGRISTNLGLLLVRIVCEIKPVFFISSEGNIQVSRLNLMCCRSRMKASTERRPNLDNLKRWLKFLSETHRATWNNYR